MVVEEQEAEEPASSEGQKAGTTSTALAIPEAQSRRYRKVPESKVDIVKIRSGQLSAMQSLESKSVADPLTPFD